MCDYQVPVKNYLESIISYNNEDIMIYLLSLIHTSMMHDLNIISNLYCILKRQDIAMPMVL